jgi:hypothetical protein
MFMDLPEGYEKWPRNIQALWLEELHALYFPKLHPWEQPDPAPTTN